MSYERNLPEEINRAALKDLAGQIAQQLILYAILRLATLDRGGPDEEERDPHVPDGAQAHRRR